MAKAYDPAYKLEVCKQVESGSATVRYRENNSRPFVGSGKILSEIEEMVRLPREVRELREENEILKKAAAYFN